jgi:hypothetical protein
MSITHTGNSPAERGWMVVIDNRKAVVAALKCINLTACSTPSSVDYATNMESLDYLRSVLFCTFGLPSRSIEGESALVCFHYCNGPPLVPAYRANTLITPPATLLTLLLANNSWRMHLQALLARMHTGLEAMQTSIAQVTRAVKKAILGGGSHSLSACHFPPSVFSPCCCCLACQL